MSITIILSGKRFWVAGLIAAFSIAAIAQMEPRAMSFMHAMKESMDRMDKPRVPARVAGHRGW